MKHKMTLYDTLAAFFLLVYFAELVFPPLTTIFPSAVVCLVCFVVWVFLCYGIDAGFVMHRDIFIQLLIYLFMVFTPLAFGVVVIANRYTAMSLVLCGNIIYSYYLRNDKMFILKKILLIAVGLSLVTMLVTYGSLLRNPFISRSIKSSGEYSVGLARQGIGGYSFVYYITALCIPVLYICLKTKKIMVRLIATVWYVFSLLFIVKSNYMTALLTVVLCSAILICVYLISNKKWGIAYALTAGFIVFIIGLNLNQIVWTFAHILPSRISRVLVPVGDGTVIDSILQEFIFDRWPTILESIDSCMEHPILGLVGSGEIQYGGEHLVGFGQHSYIFDTYALFGLIGGTLNLYIILKQVTKSGIWSNQTALRMSMFVCLVLLYFLNNATGSIALVFTIIAPYVAKAIAETEDKFSEEGTA